MIGFAHGQVIAIVHHVRFTEYLAIVRELGRYATDNARRRRALGYAVATDLRGRRRPARRGDRQRSGGRGRAGHSRSAEGRTDQRHP